MSLELLVGHVGALSELIQKVIPAESVCPFVNENFDCVMLPKSMAELNDELMAAMSALAKGVVGEPGSPDDDGFGGWA